MRVNFSGSSIPDFSPIPPGEYQVRATDGEVKDSQSGATDKNPTGQYIMWTLTVQDGEYAGRKVFTNTPLGGTGLGFLKGLLWASGKLENKNYDGDLDFEIQDVIDSGGVMLARVTVDKERDSNNVKRLRPYSEAGAVESLLPS